MPQAEIAPDRDASPDRAPAMGIGGADVTIAADGVHVGRGCARDIVRSLSTRSGVRRSESSCVRAHVATA